MTDVTDAITQAANENGVDPATALAIAERESSLDPNNRPGINKRTGKPASSAYGLFQLLDRERAQFGGSSSDPYEQASAWGHYIQGTRNDMVRVLGRDPTGPELYLGHYWGGTRAARIINGNIPPDTPVDDVWSFNELDANHNIRDAGTVGNITSSVMADINRRIAKFGGSGDIAVTGGASSADLPYVSSPSIADSGVPFPAAATADTQPKLSSQSPPPPNQGQQGLAGPMPLNQAVPGPPQVPGV